MKKKKDCEKSEKIVFPFLYTESQCIWICHIYTKLNNTNVSGLTCCCVHFFFLSLLAPVAQLRCLCTLTMPATCRPISRFIHQEMPSPIMAYGKRVLQLYSYLAKAIVIVHIILFTAQRSKRQQQQQRRAEQNKK